MIIIRVIIIIIKFSEMILLKNLKVRNNVR